MPALRKPRTFRSVHIDGSVNAYGTDVYFVTSFTDAADLKTLRRLRDWLNKAITWMEYKQAP